MNFSKITVIEPRKGWQVIDLTELLRYIDLFYFLVLREIKVLYKQTILGFSWAIIRPVFSMIIFSIIFGELAKFQVMVSPYLFFHILL